MSTSDPFLPFPEPRAEGEPDPREHDLDPEADVLIEPSVDDPDAERAAAAERARALDAPFRTPVAGDRLTAEELEADLGDASQD
ncbi:MAG: hypothetical protein Q7T71_01685 [Herbiconiux sp.]|nr:hypothetical protein [Herbiconiux sp.]